MGEIDFEAEARAWLEREFGYAWKQQCIDLAAKLREVDARARAALLPPEPAKCTLCGNVHQFGEICLASIHGARR